MRQAKLWLLSWRTSVSAEAHSGAENWPRWRNAFVDTSLIMYTRSGRCGNGAFAFGVAGALSIFMAETEIVSGHDSAVCGKVDRSGNEKAGTNTTKLSLHSTANRKPRPWHWS